MLTVLLLLRQYYFAYARIYVVVISVIPCDSCALRGGLSIASSILSVDSSSNSYPLYPSL